MADVRALGSTFAPREAPDAAAYVRRSITSSPYRYIARVRYLRAAGRCGAVFSAASVDIEPDGPDACIVTTGADDPERMVPYLAMPGCDFEVLEPPEVVEAARTMAARRCADAVGAVASAPPAPWRRGRCRRAAHARDSACATNRPARRITPRGRAVVRSGDVACSTSTLVDGVRPAQLCAHELLPRHRYERLQFVRVALPYVRTAVEPITAGCDAVDVGPGLQAVRRHAAVRHAGRGRARSRPRRCAVSPSPATSVERPCG